MKLEISLQFIGKKSYHISIKLSNKSYPRLFYPNIQTSSNSEGIIIQQKPKQTKSAAKLKASFSFSRFLSVVNHVIS